MVMYLKQFTKISNKTAGVILLVLVCVLLQFCFWTTIVYAKESATEITSRITEPPALPDGEMPETFPRRGDVHSEQQRPSDVDPASGNTQNRMPMQNEQQLNENSNSETLLISLAVLLFAFVFVKFYKRKNY